MWSNLVYELYKIVILFFFTIITEAHALRMVTVRNIVYSYLTYNYVNETAEVVLVADIVQDLMLKT